MSDEKKPEPTKPHWAMALLLNLLDWLARKKTKTAMSASLPVVYAWAAGEVTPLQGMLTLAGIWMAAGAGFALEDVGKAKAREEAKAGAELARRANETPAEWAERLASP